MCKTNRVPSVSNKMAKVPCVTLVTASAKGNSSFANSPQNRIWALKNRNIKKKKTSSKEFKTEQSAREQFH